METPKLNRLRKLIVPVINSNSRSVSPKEKVRLISSSNNRLMKSLSERKISKELKLSPDVLKHR